MLRLFGATLLLFALQCGQAGTDVAGGNTSDVGNGIVAGIVRMPDGSAAPNARVRAVAADFAPVLDSASLPDFIETTSDNKGYYVFSRIEGGIYTVEVSRDTLGVIMDSVMVRNTSDTSNVPDLYLTGVGTITGISYMAGADYYMQSRQNVFIQGTSFYTTPEYGGRFSLNQVPAGSYTLTIAPMPPWVKRDIDVAVTAGATVDLDTIFVGY